MRKQTLKGLAVGLVAVFALAACGSSSSTSDTVAADTTVAADAPGTGMKIGLLYDITGRGDKSFNDAAAMGYDKAMAEFSGATFTESAPTGDEDRRAAHHAGPGRAPACRHRLLQQGQPGCL